MLDVCAVESSLSIFLASRSVLFGLRQRDVSQSGAGFLRCRPLLFGRGVCRRVVARGRRRRRASLRHKPRPVEADARRRVPGSTRVCRRDVNEFTSPHAVRSSNLLADTIQWPLKSEVNPAWARTYQGKAFLGRGERTLVCGGCGQEFDEAKNDIGTCKWYNFHWGMTYSFSD